MVKNKMKNLLVAMAIILGGSSIFISNAEAARSEEVLVSYIHTINTAVQLNFTHSHAYKILSYVNGYTRTSSTKNVTTLSRSLLGYTDTQITYTYKTY
ncbi:hypothetical protein [Cytobacillus firmus]|uniref:hypothetical protein n=1 Tax=Cytobacillus firmus TaxID=1399 RepID=UPI003001CAA7